MNTSSRHILIADDHGVVRYGMMLLLKDLMPWAKISQIGSFNEVVDFVEKTKIDLLILDINLPGGNNIQMLESLNAVQKGIKVLMFSAYEESLYATRYLKAGAKGYLHKQTSNSEIKKAIATVFSGGIYMSDDVKDLMVNKMLNHDEDQSPLDILSNREFEVAQLLIYGHGITDISTLLKLKISTVSTYKNRIFEKLNVINIVQLIDKFRFWKITDSN
jgi:two-component system invasion response regulator UvrY